jgi:hypothetical protein
MCIGRHDILLDKTSDPADYAAEFAKNYNSKPEVTGAEITKTVDIGSKRSVKQNLLIGHYLILNLLDALKITDPVLQLMIVDRILNTEASFTSFKNLGDRLYGDWNFPLKDFYKQVEHICLDYKKMQREIHQAVIELLSKHGRSRIGEAQTVFYNLSSYFFETSTDQTSVKRAPNKEHLPVSAVQMGIFTDSYGMPIVHKIFLDNTLPSLTYLNNVEEILEDFKIKHVTKIAKTTVRRLQESDYRELDKIDYIFVCDNLGVHNCPGQVLKEIVDKNGWQYDMDLGEAKKTFTFPMKFADGRLTREVKMMAVWTAAKDVRDQLNRDGKILHMNEVKNHERYQVLTHRGGRHFQKLLLLDRINGGETLAYPGLNLLGLHDYEHDDALFDGVTLLFTNRLDFDDEFILERHIQESHLVEYFEAERKELHLMPQFIFTKEYLRAHFFISFVGLLVMRLIRYYLGPHYTPRRIITALNSLTVRHFSGDYYETEASDDAVDILGQLGIDWTRDLQSITNIERLRRTHFCFPRFPTAF